MTPTRRHALALLGTTALAVSCTPAIVTRDASDPFEGGIGGTGIVGTLYGFSSLLINGLRVTLDGRTVYRSPYGPIASDTLLQGQVLTVSAQRSADGLVAREVMVDYALVGTLSHAHGGPSVNGVSLIAAANALGHGAPGSRVAVSGTWTAHGLRPSRVDPAPSGPDLIAGTVQRLPDASGIGGVSLSGSARLPQPGSYAVAFGQASGGGFVADRVTSDRFRNARNLRLLSVEGYLEPIARAPGFRIAGLGHNFARDVGLGVIGGRRAVYFGRYDGLFGARRGFIVPDGYTARANTLRGGLGDGFTGPVLEL